MAKTKRHLAQVTSIGPRLVKASELARRAELDRERALERARSLAARPSPRLVAPRGAEQARDAFGKLFADLDAHDRRRAS